MKVILFTDGGKNEYTGIDQVDQTNDVSNLVQKALAA